MFFKRAKEQHHENNGADEMQSTIPKARGSHSKSENILEAMDRAIKGVNSPTIQKYLNRLGHSSESLNTLLGESKTDFLSNGFQAESNSTGCKQSGVLRLTHQTMNIPPLPEELKKNIKEDIMSDPIDITSKTREVANDIWDKTYHRNTGNFRKALEINRIELCTDYPNCNDQIIYIHERISQVSMYFD